ncbi:MAG: molybdenum cofactor biosynthesis protein MoaE [Legionella longbeachae]|nr:molybdenum cofactor biosynthesis protein MoaE [Legionella longbeachae]
MNDLYQCLITSEAITTAQAIPYITANENGAMCHFVGVVRDHNHGKAVMGIDYEVCEPLASTILKQISEEALQRFPRLKVYIAHFSGYLNVGEISMLVSTSTPHRDEVYQSNRFIVEAIKQRCPIWKKEYYVDTSAAWVKGCTIKHEHLA